ncbi:hypothetical protein [Humidisolicoccus flavus]|uniref:hypothetical protein n=1 Tax=Humidisolicoccus flavus TaxID=3111414 RepID=UPI00325662CB
MRTRTRTLTLSATAVAALLTLSACVSPPEEAAEAPDTQSPSAEPTTAETPSPSESDDDSDTDSEESEAPAATGGQPSWADPVTTPGEMLTTIEVGDVTIDVYQVGVVASPKTGNFVNPDDNKPIIDVGDDIVFVNYIITNEGDPIDLGASLVTVNAEYDDWPYLQGMDSITDFDLFEEMEVNRFGATEFLEPGVYTFGTGDSFSYGANFRYQENSPIEFSARFTPVDAEGELIHDDRIEADSESVIK